MQGFILINHASLDSSAEAAALALVLASMEGMAAADARAQEKCGDIVDRVFLEDSQAPADRMLAAMIADEEYTSDPETRRPDRAGGRSAASSWTVWPDSRLIGGTLLGQACSAVGPLLSRGSPYPGLIPAHTEGRPGSLRAGCGVSSSGSERPTAGSKGTDVAGLRVGRSVRASRAHCRRGGWDR